jgi:hypothetical protein
MRLPSIFKLISSPRHKWVVVEAKICGEDATAVWVYWKKRVFPFFSIQLPRKASSMCFSKDSIYVFNALHYSGLTFWMLTPNRQVVYTHIGIPWAAI